MEYDIRWVLHALEYIILGGLLNDWEISVLIVVGNSRESCCLCFGKGGVNCDSWICVEDCPNFLLPCVHVYMIWMNKMLLFNFKNKKQIGEEDLSMVLFKRDEIILLKTQITKK